MKKIVRILWFMVAMMIISCATIHAAVTDPGNGNPILPGYFADPSIHLFNGTYYIYGTTDGNTITGGPPSVWSSTDAVNWTNRKMSINATFTHFWAAACVYANNKYYLYYSCPDRQGSFVADSTSPIGPWTERAKNGIPRPAKILDESILSPHMHKTTPV